MTGMTRTSDGLDPRRRRILYRSWHRGTREMDLVLGPFVEAEVEGLDADELDVLEHLMDAPDQELYAWFTGAKATPEGYDTPLFKRICAFHAAGS
ncbi:FAD assembly factor SdhE [Rhodobium gokarnense]|nr:succinate dehydrogenase assembly factor 2 [Rhodobium gokarnense]